MLRNLAGEEGLEPSHVGIKIRCLDQLGDSPTRDTAELLHPTTFSICPARERVLSQTAADPTGPSFAAFLGKALKQYRQRLVVLAIFPVTGKYGEYRCSRARHPGVAESLRHQVQRISHFTADRLCRRLQVVSTEVVTCFLRDSLSCFCRCGKAHDYSEFFGPCQQIA